MRLFASWWERLPMRQIGAVVAVVAVVGFVSFNGGVLSRLGFAQLHSAPTSEVWT